MTVQGHFVATQGQAMMSQANIEVGHRVKQNFSTIVSSLREYTRMNPPMFSRYKVNEDPQDFLDVVYMILYAMGVISNEMDSRLRDFIRMNPPMFIRSKVNEYPQDFLDEVYKILYAMVVSYN